MLTTDKINVHLEREPRALTFPRPGLMPVRRNAARVPRGGHLLLVPSEIERDDVPA